MLIALEGMWLSGEVWDVNFSCDTGNDSRWGPNVGRCEVSDPRRVCSGLEGIVGIRLRVVGPIHIAGAVA